ncbi:MAG: HupE/UreJ family protein [Verrucomicrobiales bacterium]|nr:HupE/UreJ family protein [Verrucomicrobiales bacterium]
MRVNRREHGRIGFGLWLIAFLTLLPCSAQAHKPSDSYLGLKIERHHVAGQWDLAIRDLDYALGLDSNDDSTITWGEIKEHQPEITRYAFEHLSLSIDGQNAALSLTEMLIDRHSDGAYVVLRFSSPLSIGPQQLTVNYQALFDLDAHHRGLLRLESSSGIQTAIFSPGQPLQTFGLDQFGRWNQWLAFVGQGVWHIWIGLDHILFLIALLLPAVLLRRAESWRRAESFSAAFRNVLKIVTSFSLAHSLTLGLATFGVVQLPSRFVESVIAASVVLAALHNFFPIFKGKDWLAAFGFGLIHGFGFANVLADLGLADGTLLLALTGFNAGVEAGQLAIVSVFLPVAYFLRGSWLYHAVAFRLGSALIVLIASVWAFERLFDRSWLGF